MALSGLRLRERDSWPQPYTTALAWFCMAGWNYVHAKRGKGSGPHGNKNARAFVPSSHSLLNAATNLISLSPLVSPHYLSIYLFRGLPLSFSISVSPAAFSPPPCPSYRDFPRNCGLDRANTVSFVLDLLFPGLRRGTKTHLEKEKQNMSILLYTISWIYQLAVTRIHKLAFIKTKKQLNKTCIHISSNN